MDRDHPSVGWVIKMGAEINIQEDPAVTACGWQSFCSSLGSCAVAHQETITTIHKNQQEPRSGLPLTTKPLQSGCGSCCAWKHLALLEGRYLLTYPKYPTAEQL